MSEPRKPLFTAAGWEVTRYAGADPNEPGGMLLGLGSFWARRVGEVRWRPCATWHRSGTAFKRHIEEQGQPPWATVDCECAGEDYSDGFIAKDWSLNCKTCGGTGNVLDPRARETA